MPEMKTYFSLAKSAGLAGDFLISKQIFVNYFATDIWNFQVFYGCFMYS